MTDDNLPVPREMLETALDQMHRGEGVDVEPAQLRRELGVRYAARRRPLPADAYVRPGLGDLPLSQQLRTAFALIADTLIPLVDGIENKQPEVVQCTVCRRNMGGWPDYVLADHYWQHTWLQRKLAKIGIH